MSIRITRSLQCDGPDCHATAFELDHVESAAVDMRKVAVVEHGWQVYAPGGKDYCPGHRTTKPRGAEA